MTGKASLFLRLTTGKKSALYQLVCIPSDPRVAVTAWKIYKTKDKCYEVAIDPKGYETCTCPDHIYRGGKRCKHVRAMQALGLLPRSR